MKAETDLSETWPISITHLTTRVRETNPFDKRCDSVRSAIATVLMLVIVLLVACSDSPSIVNDEDFPAMGKLEVSLPIDGSHEGYQETPIEVIGVQIHMAHDGDFLYVHLRADIDGWLAVGFNVRGGGMDGANMIIGYLEGEEPSVRDDVGQGQTHAEAATRAVEDFSLLREDEARILEFSYPLTFRGDNDYHLEGLTPGEIYTLLVAYNASSDDVSRKHSRVGRVDFVVVP